MAWIDSKRRVIHDDTKETIHCALPKDMLKRAAQTIDSQVYVLAMIETGRWRVCKWCIGPAETTQEALGLVTGTLTRETLEDKVI